MSRAEAPLRRLLGMTIRRDKLRQGAWNLDSREPVLSLAVSDQHRKIETAIRDVRERPAGIEGQRRQYRKNRVAEIGVRDALAACHSIRSNRGRRYLNPRSDIRQIPPALVRLHQQFLHLSADGDQLRGWAHSIGPGFHRSCFDLQR